MGFYAPAQIVGDASKNGVTVREIDVSFSFGQNSGKHHVLRLGFRQIDGFEVYDPDGEELIQKGSSARRKPRKDHWDQRIIIARAQKPFASLEDFAREQVCRSAR